MLLFLRQQSFSDCLHIYPTPIANTVLKECKCNLKHTAKICKTTASQTMGILAAVNTGTCLAYFLILATIMISSALRNATILGNSAY